MKCSRSESNIFLSKTPSLGLRQPWCWQRLLFIFPLSFFGCCGERIWLLSSQRETKSNFCSVKKGKIISPGTFRPGALWILWKNNFSCVFACCGLFAVVFGLCSMSSPCVLCVSMHAAVSVKCYLSVDCVSVCQKGAIRRLTAVRL